MKKQDIEELETLDPIQSEDRTARRLGCDTEPHLNWWLQTAENIDSNRTGNILLSQNKELKILPCNEEILWENKIFDPADYFVRFYETFFYIIITSIWDFVCVLFKILLTIFFTFIFYRLQPLLKIIYMWN